MNTLNDWRPDWRNPDNYPSDLARSQWRWEFIRRSDEYQKAYADAEPNGSRGTLSKKGANLECTLYPARKASPKIKKRWGIDRLYHPATPSLPTDRLRSGVAVTITTAPVTTLWDLGYVVCVLDPNISMEDIKNGVEQAMNMVGNKKRTRESRKHFPLYLRMLDADHAKVRPTAVARQLNLEGKEDIDCREAARQIRRAKKTQKQLMGLFISE